MSLYPSERIAPVDTMVRLEQLPADGDLTGEGPGRALVESVRTMGILQPIGVVPNESGYHVAFGRRRVKAARACGLEEIPARVFPADWAEEAVLTLIENGHRGDNPLADLFALEYLRSQGHTYEMICQETGIGLGTVRNRLRLRQLIPALFQALTDGRITVGVAQRIALLTEAQQERLVPLLDDPGKITVHDTEEARRVAAAEVVAALDDDIFETPTVDADDTDATTDSPLVQHLERALVLAHGNEYLSDLLREAVEIARREQ